MPAVLRVGDWIIATTIKIKSMLRLLINFMLWYTPEEGEVEPNGKSF